MSTSKRSAEDITIDERAGVVLSSGGAASMSGSKRAKTAASTTTSPADDADSEPNPIQSVLANPDTLSKTLLCLNIEDIPAAARTCKVWNLTLDSIQDKLWLGLVREHHPTLETIRSMLPDDGVGWKETFKRRRTIKAPELIRPPPAKPLDSYVFEVICKPWRMPPNSTPVFESELATVIEKATFKSGKFLRLFHFKSPSNNSFLSVRAYDRFSGRQAVLLDHWSPYFGENSKTVGEVVHCRSEDSEQVEVQLHARPRLIKPMGCFALELSFSVDMYQEQGGRLQINESAELVSAQILDMIQNHLDWK